MSSMQTGRTKISEEMCSAYVDGELDARDEAELLEALSADPSLREEVASTRILKELVRSAYADGADGADVADAGRGAGRDRAVRQANARRGDRDDGPAAQGQRASRSSRLAARFGAQRFGAQRFKPQRSGPQGSGAQRFGSGALSRSAGLLLLVLGFGFAGWQLHGLAGGAAPGLLAAAVGAGSELQASSPSAGRAAVGSLAEARESAAERVLVHVSSGDPAEMDAALVGIEALLESARAEDRRLALEVVVNSRGIDLVRGDVTPYGARIAALQKRYPELAIVACSQTLSRLREQGVRVDLIPGVTRVTSALDRVVRRLHEGWLYVRT